MLTVVKYLSFRRIYFKKLLFYNRATAHEVKVSLGEYDRCTLDISSVNNSVEFIALHPEFNPDSNTHDLALIRLSRPIKFEKRIAPVCLPNPGLFSPHFVERRATEKENCKFFLFKK